jgi:putative hydrolase of the HAD superfamily
MSSRPVRAVLFDLGDTLIQYGRVDKNALFREAAWRTYEQWARRQRRMPDFRRYYLHQAFALRWGYLKLLLRRREMNAMRLIRRACRKLMLNSGHGPGQDEDRFFEELAWRWYEPLAEVATLEPRTEAALRMLRRRGLLLGVVSNTFVPGHVLDRHLRELGLLQHLPVRVYSCDVGYRKPHHAIFDIAVDQMGVPAAQTLFVGDTYDADVSGALRAGLRPVWKRNTINRAEPNPDAVACVDRLAQLPRLVDELNGRRPRNVQATGTRSAARSALASPGLPTLLRSPART